MKAGGAGGFTLVELLVVLAMMAALTGVAAFTAGGWASTRAGTIEDHIGRARRTAVLTGRPVVVHIVDSAAGMAKPVRLLPDGRVIGDGIDPVRGVK